MKKTLLFAILPVLFCMLCSACAMAAMYSSAGGSASSVWSGPGGVVYLDSVVTGKPVYPPSFCVWGALNFDTNASVTAVNVFAGTNTNTARFYKTRFICQMAGLPQGTNSVTVVVTLDNGSSFSRPFAVTVNTNLPSVRFTLPGLFLHTNTNAFNIPGMIDVTNSVIALYAGLYGQATNPLAVAPAWVYPVTGLNSEGVQVLQAQIMDTNSYVNNLAAMLVNADFTPPSIVSNYPGPGGDFSKTDSVKVYFSEPVSTDSLGSFIMVKNGATPVAVSYYAQKEGSVITLAPTTALADGTTYTLFVSNGLSDLAGNHIQSNASYLFSTIFPPSSDNPVFADTALLTVTYPTNKTVNMRSQASSFMWVPAPQNSTNSVYKYYFLIFTARIQAQGKAIVNKTDAVRYWSSDLGSGTVGNIDFVWNTCDVVGGNTTSSTNYQFVNNQVYYMVVYGVDRYYRVNTSSKQIMVSW